MGDASVRVFRDPVVPVGSSHSDQTQVGFNLNFWCGDSVDQNNSRWRRLFLLLVGWEMVYWEEPELPDGKM